MAEILRDDALERVLANARTIAVLGASTYPSRPACWVPDYLAGQGYRILPVNPAHLGATLWGEPVRATLAELGEPVDIVDVFRRSDALAAHVDDLLAMRPPPKVVWLQSGIRDDAFARRLVAAGIDVVQSRCTYAEHRAHRLGPVG